MSMQYTSGKIKSIILACGCFLICLVFVQCTTDTPVPKPRTFPRMTMPARTPVNMNLTACPFVFEFSDYAKVNHDKKFFKEQPPHACWFDLHMPDFNADLFLSYHPISTRKDFDKLIADTYKITNQINRRSNYMEELRIENSSGVSGMKFLFEGAAASPIHFYMSDTTQHFVKGALYYNHKVHADSMQPATQFILEDIDRMLASFRWK